MPASNPLDWSKTGEAPVPYALARHRVLAGMRRGKGSWNASSIGGLIWPNNRMKAQGLALAAGKIIKQMERDGLIRWTCDRHLNSRGYVLVQRSR